MITEFLDKNKIPRDTRLLCAVSGGADSMCLLAMALREGLNVCAAHYEHGLRGEESLRDCRFVEDFCREKGIELIVEHGDVGAYAKDNKLGTEEAARLLRYAFLEESAKKAGCAYIATAHNADDNAETVLFNLTRGGGAKGLSGIPPVRGNIIRPLLSMTREQIEAYNAENGIGHVEDSTNQSTQYSRNLIRHKVMPILRELNPAFAEAVLRSAESLRADEELLESLAAEFVSSKLYDGALPVNELKELPQPIRMRVYRALCGRGLGAVHAQSIDALLCGKTHAHADVCSMRVTRDGALLYFGAKSTEIPDRELKIGTPLHLPELDMTVYSSFSEKCRENFKTVHKLLFNYEKICGSISITSRRAGDKIRLKGRGCTKSLKDLFRESGMTQKQRELALVVRDELGVIAVCGFGVAERCAPERGHKLLCLTFDNNKNQGNGGKSEG